jgi:hypothetical protein
MIGQGREKGKANATEISEALRHFFGAGEVIEIRIPNTRKRTVSGYFDDFGKAAKAAAEWSGRAPGIYFVLNQVDRALLGRANNRLVEYAQTTTADADIVRRRWFFVDFDAKRPAGISATDAEHEAALAMAARCRDHLSGCGWPSPIEADSGNGTHLLYLCDLPNDEPSRDLFERSLKALDFLFSDETVQVDCTTFNAARITKCYGTAAGKGDATADRPHRFSHILTVPSPLNKVPVDLFEALVNMGPPEPEPSPWRGAGSNGQHHPFELERWIAVHPLTVVRSGPWKGGGYRWVLNPCPFNPAHTDNSAVIVRWPDGHIGARCWHNGCSGKGWHDLRDVVEPGWRDRHQTLKQNGTAPHHSQWRRGPKSTHKGDPADEAPRQPVIATLADLTAQPVHWFKRLWIPRAALTLLDGDPGLGKSTLTLDFAAQASRGQTNPLAIGAIDAADPSDVLLLSAEDDLARTIRPRLDAAGADVRRVHALAAVRTGDEECPPVLPYDLALVEQMIRDRNIALVVVDPLMAFLPGEIDAHRDQDVRRCMHRLRLLAEATDAAIVLIRHLNKMGHAVAMYRGGGSIGITGAARSTLVVGRDPANPSIRILASVKSNLGPPPRSLTYSLEPVGDVAQIGWIGETDLGANDILGHEEPKAKRTTLDQCADAITELLGHGPKESEDLNAAMIAAGYSDSTIRRAKQKLKVRARKVGYGAEGPWLVRLPPADSPAEGAQRCSPRPEHPQNEHL